MSSSEEEDIYPSLSADEVSSEEQESSSESNDDRESEDEEYVPADDENLDESATEPLIEDAEEMAAMLNLVQENAIVTRKMSK